jgi:hypothetical protein
VSGAPAAVWALMSGYPRGERERRLLMVLQACIEMDETINPSFVVAGFIAESEAWAQFSSKWDAALALHPSVEYLKMVEAAHRTGQFTGWSADEVRDRLRKLVSIIREFAIMRVSVSVDKRAFFKNARSLAIPARNHNTDKPYCMAFQKLLLEVPQIQLLHAAIFGSRPRPVDFIFDEQGEIGLEAQATWLNIKRLAERFAQQGRTNVLPCFGSMPIFSNDKDVRPLQAADLYAWHLRRFFYENRNLIVPPHSFLKELSGIPSVHAHIDDRLLQEIRFGQMAAVNDFSRKNPSVELFSYHGSKAQQKRNRVMRRRLAKNSQNANPSSSNKRR